MTAVKARSSACGASGSVNSTQGQLVSVAAGAIAVALERARDAIIVPARSRPRRARGQWERSYGDAVSGSVLISVLFCIVLKHLPSHHPTAIPPAGVTVDCVFPG
jgi:hypothetical protein